MVLDTKRYDLAKRNILWEMWFGGQLFRGEEGGEKSLKKFYSGRAEILHEGKKPIP